MKHKTKLLTFLIAINIIGTFISAVRLIGQNEFRSSVTNNQPIAMAQVTRPSTNIQPDAPPLVGWSNRQENTNIGWASDQLSLEPNVLHLFVGETVNTTIDSHGFGELGLVVFPDNTVSGFFNHDNYPGEIITCAASDVTGTLIGNQLEISFFIYDTSPGCKALDGVEETFSGLVLENGTRIMGTFSVLGHAGTWDLTRSD